jgi:hypothetical protein
MDREDWGKKLFYGVCVVEGATGGFLGLGDSIVEIISILVLLAVILPFVVGYVAAKLGLVYGLVLGIAPAFHAIFSLPSHIFGLPPFGGVGVLLLAAFLASALSGVAGQRFASWRDAA